ncbi:MAG TPA: transglycosylase SLT domain-containing protein [Verrucomicrobiae bacterium]|nr:transglycosylase SLT domain-containing protein [Verrucomicrobiae bacterium]
MAVAAACAARPSGTAPAELAAAAPAQGEAAELVADAARDHPVLADYALYFQALAARAAGRPGPALESARRLVSDHPDSIWVGPAWLMAGQLERSGGDLASARASLAAARAALPAASARWPRATLSLAEVEGALGEPGAALELARELRRARPRGLAARRARRLAERIRATHPEILLDHADEAEMRLREGDVAGAREQAEMALAGAEPLERARILWLRAQAEHALGLGPAAEATCLAIAQDTSEPLAPRALMAAAGWRWNVDDDAGALRYFGEVLRRFPDSAQAPEALYASGRIAQEAGRWAEARAAYTRLAARYPRAEPAAEARWRAAWVRYLAGEMAAAADAFARLAGRSAGAARVAAEYWQGRALARFGREAEARALFVHVAERHPRSYYAGLAEERLGRRAAAGEPPAADRAPPFPGDLPGSHAERARLLAQLGLARFARLELDAIPPAEVPRRRLLEAYRAVGAVGAALRLAHLMRPGSPGALREYLYPLGYWETVRAAARAHGVDPLLVLAVIRQESRFEPEAVSSAGARGLMQLLPATARQLAPAGAAPALEDVATNIDLGTRLLARLLRQYEGAVVKALAAYNGGEDAVAKWERRYARRAPDEFVELISFRETRDYVKSVLRNCRAYRRIYVAESPATSSAGSPPKAPFDMTAMTSPGRAEATR